MNNCPMRFDLRKGFFFNCRNNHFESLRPCRIQHEKRKTSIARDQAKFFFRERHIESLAFSIRQSALSIKAGRFDSEDS